MSKELRFLRWGALVLLLSTAWFVVHSDSAEAQGTNENIAWMRKGVVKITASPPESSSKVGAGMIVGQDASNVYLVTAAHVIRGDSRPTVEFFTQRGHAYQAKVLASEIEVDTNGIAVLAVEVDAAQASELVIFGLDGRNLIQSGSPVSMIGHPRLTGVQWAVTRGEIIGQVERSIRFSGLVEEGNSGGPLIQNGKILGIITGTFQEFSDAVPLEIMKWVLDGWAIPLRVTLRSQFVTVPASHIAKMVREKGFHHPAELSDLGLSPSRVGTFRHYYVLKDVEKGQVIADLSTNLMWEQGGSRVKVTPERADRHIERLNQQKLGGVEDWRLPTIEELASLIEPLGVNDGLFIDPKFEALSEIWSSDRVVDRLKEKSLQVWEGVLYVSFRHGAIKHGYDKSIANIPTTKNWVRGVRSIQPHEHATLFREMSVNTPPVN